MLDIVCVFVEEQWFLCRFNGGEVVVDRGVGCLLMTCAGSEGEDQSVRAGVESVDVETIVMCQGKAVELTREKREKSGRRV